MLPARETHSRRLISLTGFMGCGKSTIGRLLARQIGWHFADLDLQIAERARMSIPEIFDRRGEPAFREMETGVLQHVLGEAVEHHKPTVIALGGGTLTQPQNLALLRSHGCLTIWIECPIEELLSRCSRITNRPLFRDETSFRQLYEQRLPFYQQADYRLQNTGEALRVVEEILALGILERVRA